MELPEALLREQEGEPEVVPRNSADVYKRQALI